MDQSSSSSSKLHPLLDDLKNVISHVANFAFNTKKDTDVHVQTKYQRTLAKLCYLLELIFNHGLKDVSLLSTTFIWNYLENLDKCLPGPEAKEVIRKIRELNKGQLGRGRVFIRLTLNEGTTAEYLKSLTFNTSLTGTYYKENAILRSEEQLNAFLSIIDIVTPFKFDFNVTDKNLDDPDYWEKVTTKSAIVNRTTLLAPEGLLSQIGKSPSFSNLETINSLVETAESTQKELQEAREQIFQMRRQRDMYKEQLDKELKEKNYSDR